MPRRENKTRYAVLGLLSLGPRSGYDIKKAFETHFSSFWSESFGQIYPILKRLEQQGLATRSTERRKGRPDRHLYTITEKGRSALEEWLLGPVQPQVGRHEMVLRMVFGSHVPAEKVMSMIRAFRDQQERELATLREQKRLMKETAKERPELVFPLLSMRYGELVNQAYIDWCNEAEARIQAMAPSGETP